MNILQATLTPGLVDDLVHDYPRVFGKGGLCSLEISDWEEALSLTGSVEVRDDEDGLFLVVDGWHYPLTEA